MAYNAQENELEVLEWWDKDTTFEKSVQERSKDKPFVFYDGPPFATGLPHYGHIVGSVMKDAIPRYQTMRGKRVERVWGWDCHGLPIENIVEKELGTKPKQEIEELGVGKFNEMCRSKVLSYVGEWEKTITRLGRWVDMKNAYRTMDKEYMESMWWVFKQLWDKDLVYKGYKSMHVCPRCETTLSQQEVSEGYQDVKDITATAKFKLTNAAEKLELDGDVFALAWTTTPWTLPGNVLLAVGAELEYVVVKFDGAHYVVAKELLEANFSEKEFEVVQRVKGSKLVGLTYEPLFSYYKETENGFRVVAAEFVTTEAGTGIVHIAPAFGDDDFHLGSDEKVGWVQHVGMNGTFNSEVTDFAGLNVKPTDDRMSTDIEIIKWLAHNDKLFSKLKVTHSYPHCWRCDTPLMNYATGSWFVAVTKVKNDALEQAKKINWSPEHIKEGRFGKWLEGARDWSISRQRFWASVMPVWECEKTTENNCEYVVFGSASELEERAGTKVDDLHKHIVDEITFDCACGATMKRIPDVLDTWFDSGSMPYGQTHYPFENKEKFDANFPAQFIAEGQDQTRAWFYYLHVIATALKGSPAFENVIVNGIVLAEDGKKMAKKLQNYPNPNTLLETYGADALRYYLMSSPIVAAENLNFAEEGVREVFNKVVNTLSNVANFYEMYAMEANDSVKATDSDNVLDVWILSKLHSLLEEVTTNMDAYKLHDSARPIMSFISELSQWWVRRSRDRFKGDDIKDKHYSLATLKEVLEVLSKVMAPFTPFIAERTYQVVKGSEAFESVHLCEWPEVNADWKNEDVVESMQQARKVVEMGLSLRKEAGIRVRQPLAQFSVSVKMSDGLKHIIAEEMNVKEVVDSAGSDWISKEDNDITVGLNTELTPELKKEGLLREVVRAVNGMRKQKGLTREHEVVISYSTDDTMLNEMFGEFGEELKKLTRAVELKSGGEEEVKVGDVIMKLSVE